MSNSLVHFPMAEVKCPVGTLAFHGVYGYVQVTGVDGLMRTVSFEESRMEQPEDENAWLRGETGTATTIHCHKVFVGELSDVNPFKTVQLACSSVTALRR